MTALHLSWPYFIKAEEFTAILPHLQVVLAHPPESLVPLGTCQERIQVFGYSVLKEHKGQAFSFASQFSIGNFFRF